MEKKLETKISLVVGDHVQQLNIFFFNVLIWFWYFLAIFLEYFDLILIFSRNRRRRCAATVRSWWRGIPRDHGAGRLFFCSYILIFIYSWYSRDHGAGRCFLLIYSYIHIWIYIFLIFSRSWHLWVFCSFIHSQYYNLFPLIYLLLNAIFRWGWPANLCMCGDYKRRCRNGFKIRVNFPFFSKSDWAFLFSMSLWLKKIPSAFCNCLW